MHLNQVGCEVLRSL
uniref:Uncharacterized protein n=1 Tax=Rhizophora mucronata TaxID=61149 RepID=A0A2P2PEG9_RHIMU